MSADLRFPPMGEKGRRKKLEAFRNALANTINQMYSHGTRWGTRGWCYDLEAYGLPKSSFDAVEAIIVDLRKSGRVPLDAVLEDVAREWAGIESVDGDPEEQADQWISILRGSIQLYSPVSFWEGLDTFVVVAVEKRDLVELFRPVCKEYHVPLANFRGSPDLLSRGKALREFMKHWEQDRDVVVLYCGDHDPAGIRMSGEEFVTNFSSMQGSILEGEHLWFDEDRFEVVRFGLNSDFISTHGLTWIENLATGNNGSDPHQKDLSDPLHKQHDYPYVQDYLRRYGARKVEANALVRRQDAGRQLCREAIERYIDPAHLKRYEAAMQPHRAEYKRELLARLQEVSL